ncbi:MAG: carbohydrate kinase family protein [Candidatus Bathyarchaeota archaeon]|nr:carbohydrate kinase family protein [Candidatus Bathyarchaeota archaeon]
MLQKQIKNELLHFLKSTPKRLSVVVMPDFFLDRLIHLNCETPSFSSIVTQVANRKGGSIDNIDQTDIRGGNAINTASALAALGAMVTPIVCTSKLGLQQIRFHLKQRHIDTSHVKLSEKASVTTALEFNAESGKANVMLRDLGSLAEFGPSNLSSDDYRAIEDADYVCLFNWAGTRKFGTELAQAVFSKVKAQGTGKTYYDTADPTPNSLKIPELMEKILLTGQVDILSVNENEAICYAAMLDSEINAQRGKMQFEQLALKAARILARRLHARIDLHTTRYSATFTATGEATAPTFKIAALRATGAGDAWNAGNIIGEANGLSDECRLVLANAVAACYLANAEGTHPTRRELARFLKSARILRLIS